MSHVPRKRFGRHFLHDCHIIVKILDALDPRPGDRVVEIGPGLGALTRPLLERLPHLHVVEIDRDLAARLEQEIGPERLTVHCADALEFDFSVLGADLRVVGNLPCNVATPPLTDAQWIRKIDLKDLRTGRQHSAPVMCQHCAEAAFRGRVPHGRSFKRADGIVLVDKHTCIGCRYCVMACPYKARSFVHENLADQKPEVPRGKGCVEGCTLCVHKIDRGDGTTAAPKPVPGRGTARSPSAT